MVRIVTIHIFYRYRVHHRLKNGVDVHYKCIKKNLLGCKCFVIYNTETKTITSFQGSHEHDNENLKSTVKDIESQYINAATMIGSSGPKRTIEEMKQFVDTCALNYLLHCQNQGILQQRFMPRNVS